jgi:hypothetical protein
MISVHFALIAQTAQGDRGHRWQTPTQNGLSHAVLSSLLNDLVKRIDGVA